MEKINGEFKDDTFLARWLSNELSNEELAGFEKSTEFAQYQKLIAGADLINSANFDQEEVLRAIKAGRDKKQVGKSINAFWLYGAAASVLVVCGIFLFSMLSNPDPITIASGVGEMKTITLPDGSEMTLNANSQASYVEEDWNENRSISLVGEAYFSVETGNNFTVATSGGEVTVLGTQFTVQAIDDFFEVKCFEGSVRVESGSDQEVLEPKRAFRKISQRRGSTRTIAGTTPTWMKNESSFTSMPIKYVLVALSNQYNIKFQGKTAFNDLTFSGTFPHNDLEVALKIVFGSLQIDYTVNGDGTVVLEE